MAPTEASKFASAVVAGQDPPVLEVADDVLDSDAL